MQQRRNCERCGISQAVLSESLHVHHRDRNPQNNAPGNLQILCRACHNAIHVSLNREFGRVIPRAKFVKQSVSFPVDQLDWLREEAEREEHGNLSRIVQEAVKAYRLQRMVEQLERSANGLERVA
jgi:hypothetical protein